MKNLLYIVLLLFSFNSLAQDLCFRAYNAQGEEIQVLCVGQEVEFKDCDDQVPDDKEYYLFNYKGEDPIPTPTSTIKTHTYNAPGTYRVLQIANYGGTRGTDTLSMFFEVREAPVPAFNTRNCANSTVSVDITDDNYDSYIIDFGDGQQPINAQPSSSVQHRYSTQGSYTITVEGTYSGGSCTGTGTSTVTTFPPAPQPFIHSLTVLQQMANGQIQLALQALQPGYRYIVQQQQGNTFTTIDTIRNVTQATLSHQLQNVNTTEGVQYLVKPTDACGTNFQGSNTVSSIALEATSGNEQIALSWRNASFTGSFEIYRNGVLIQTLNSSASTFTDTEVTCGQAYQYEVRGIASDGSVSVSAPQEVQATSTTTPAAPYLLTTFNLNNQVLLNLELPQGESVQQIEVERSVSGGTFLFLGNAQQTSFTDEGVTTEPVCYRVTYRNACGNTSAYSNVSCPVILQAQKQENGATVSLTWSAYEGSPNGVRAYTVELLDENNNIINSYPATGNAFTDRNLSDELPRLRYRIRATSSNGAAVTYSNIAFIDQDVMLYIPSGFTPNGDGLNDVFEIKGRLFDSYSLRVYNRLGNVIYQGTEADAGWDGTYKGETLPDGAYVYEIVAQNRFGATKRRTGTITLLR